MEKKDWHKEYLVKCAGFGDPPWDRELDSMLEKWRRAANNLKLTEDDLKYVVTEWIPRNFDIELEGTRKVIGVMTAEAVDMMLANERKARGEKMVYGVLPAHTTFYRALKFTDPKINVYFIDANFVSFIQPLFHKIAPFLDYAEERGVRYGCRHCALNKARYTLLRQGIVPLPDVSWIWGFICDQAPKSDEFINEYWNKEYPIIYSRWSHHGRAHEKEYQNEEMVRYLASVMREGYQQVCQVLGIKVDEKAIMKALEERMAYLTKYAELSQFMAADPAPFSGEIPLMLSHGLWAAFNTGYKYYSDALDAVIKDAKAKVARGEGIVPKGSPSGMMWFMPYCNPFIMRMFEENGVVIAFCDALLPSKADLEPLKFDDPFEANAEAFLKEAMMTNWGTKADLTIEKMANYNVDFMIWGFEDFDRWLGSDQKLCRAYVEKRTGKPCFYIEGDEWEDRDYSQESMRTRIETICEIVKARLAANT